MCGIGGIIRTNTLREEDSNLAKKLINLLRHRGPDGEGTYKDKNALLIQTRLRLIGDETVNLPISTECGRYTLVYNGEVYNFPEIKRQLAEEGPIAYGLLDSGTDTDVVFAAVLRWGPQALLMLNGMFAFFLWDKEQRKGFLATDRLGIKPVFYHSDNTSFAFASEAGALIESGILTFRPDIDVVAEALIAPYFSGSISTPFSGIERLPAGHWLEFSDKGMALHKYYSFHYSPEQGLADINFLDELDLALEKATEKSLRTDFEVGLFLSGGIDSSLIASYAKKNSTRKLKSWTISFEGEDLIDYKNSLIVRSSDIPFARQVATALGLEQTELCISPTEYEKFLLNTLKTNDLICAWEQEVSQQLLAASASTKVKAVIVGDAADETHFGYSFLLDPTRGASPKSALEFFGRVPLSKRYMRDPLSVFDEKFRRVAEADGYTWENSTEQMFAMSSLISKLWLGRLLYNGDIHLMHYSLEGRVPFGDMNLLALAERIPIDFISRQGIEKWHLRKVAERHLPREIAWRPKSSLTKYMEAQIIIHRHFVSAWTEASGFLDSLVDADSINRLISQGPPKDERTLAIEFRILSVLTWFRRFSGVTT